MTRDELKERLAMYRIERARMNTMEIEKRKCERAYASAHRDRTDELAGAGAQKLTGMPGGGKNEGPVERAAVKLIDEPTNEERYLTARIAEMEKGITEIRDRVEMVEEWLNMLNERERYLVWQRLVMQLTWDETARGYAEKFGIEYTSKHLINKVNAAADLICKAAGNVV